LVGRVPPAPGDADGAERERDRQELRDLAERLERLEAEALELSVRCRALLDSMGVRPEQPRPPRRARSRRPGDTP
jgi:hypothetical protein